MKVCKKCGNVVGDDIKFCPECGDNMSAPATVQNQYTGASNYQPQQYGVPDYEPMPVYNSFEEPQKPKKSKIKKFLSVVLKVFIAFMAIIIFAVVKGALSDKSSSLSSGTDSNDNFYGTTSFTVGEITDGVYTNEWANIKYNIPEGYVPLTGEEINAVSEKDVDENTGFYIVSGGNSLTLLFENYSYSVRFTGVEDYLDSLIDDTFETEMVNEGYGVEITEKSTCNIAQREFIYFHVVLSYGEESYCQSVYTTKIDGRMTVLYAASESAEENEAMVLGIEAIR